jgi:hypothetical protein
MSYTVQDLISALSGHLRDAEVRIGVWKMMMDMEILFKLTKPLIN